MLEKYFKKSTTIDRIQQSWIADPIEQYVVWLSQREFSPSSVTRRVPLLIRFGEFARARGAR